MAGCQVLLKKPLPDSLWVRVDIVGEGERDMTSFRESVVYRLQYRESRTYVGK